MSSDIAIKVENLSKCYQIYENPRDRLKQFILPKVQSCLGLDTKQYYQEFWALRDVSFEIERGETVGIVGRNGSGKSTLLQLICGTLSATHGNVQTYGRIAALLELGSGFNPEFTGRENVFMNAAVLGLKRDEVEARFDEIAAFADIGNFIEQPIKTYSSGMVVRLAFAVNIMSTPEIMVVDEALAVGDAAFQAKCMTALTRIQNNGATVLFVSHDISALKSLCSRGIYLEKGRVQKIGKATDVSMLYMKAVCEEMNSENASKGQKVSNTLEKKLDQKITNQSNDEGFKESVEFENRVKHFRYGEGGAKITYVELLDERFQKISHLEFNQVGIIRIYIESSMEGEVSCGYFIMDDKKNAILGASLPIVNPEKSFLDISKGGRYVVTFKTRFPLQDADYSIQLQLTKPIIKGHTAVFLDMIDDAIVFKMSRRDSYRIWAKAYIHNDVEIQCL
jgi:lipopolysaccharide transport system ATP-binding protein